VKSFLTAIAFMTRIPVGRFCAADEVSVGYSAGWFPLVGLLLGAVGSLAAASLKDYLPFAVVAVLLVILDALLTGALHYDGLADTSDGFGAGRNREDILRIMRDHAIGSYGGVALVVLIAFKVTAYSSLLKQANWIPALILTPALGRWSILLLTAALPYARPSASVIKAMGRRPLVWGTLVVAAALGAARSGRACAAAAAVLAVTACFGFYCRRRIGGITGDTLGASVQLCESAALLTFLWAGHPR
jgi:cobalamin 5'-phosphate synthase/cobalamin synthase